MAVAPCIQCENILNMSQCLSKNILLPMGKEKSNLGVLGY